MIIHHNDLADAHLRRLIRRGEVGWAGNRRLKIYGHLDCASGRRLHRHNRVFFTTEAEAIDAGYRPCGHCLYVAYKAWKQKHTG